MKQHVLQRQTIHWYSIKNPPANRIMK